MTQSRGFPDSDKPSGEGFSPEEHDIVRMFEALESLPKVEVTSEPYDAIQAQILREEQESQRFIAKLLRMWPLPWVLSIVIGLFERLGSACFTRGYGERAALCWQRGLRLAELSDNREWAIAFRALLRAQAPALLREILPQSIDASTRPRIVPELDYASPPWSPRWAGELRLATAADVQPQEQTFPIADGRVTVSCQWRRARGSQQAMLQLSWQANFSTPVELWLRFIKRDDPSVLLTEDIRLGRSLAGRRNFTTGDLGFDPAEEPWALVIFLRPPQA